MAGNAIKYDICKLLEREYDLLSMGITPSGYIHPGTLSIIAVPMIYLSERDVDVEICVMDLDFDNRLPLGVPHCLAKMHGIPNKERTKYEVKSAVDIYADILKIDENTIRKNVKVSLFSEKLKEENVLDLFKKVVLDEDILFELKRIWFGSNNKKKKNILNVPYSPICPSCNLADSGYSTIDRASETLEKKCNNPNCKEQSIIVSLDSIGEYVIHYMMSPLQDIVKSNSDFEVVHILGGDYDANYGVRKSPKYKTVQGLMGLFTEDVPDVYVSPVVTVDGKKMSKSNRDATHLFKDMNSGQRYDVLDRIINTLMTTESKTIEFSEMHS